MIPNMSPDKERQKMFVLELCASVSEDIIKSIRGGKVPEKWDGHELRCLLAERFEESAKISLIRDNPRSARAKDFRNTVNVNNL